MHSGFFVTFALRSSQTKIFAIWNEECFAKKGQNQPALCQRAEFCDNGLLVFRQCNSDQVMVLRPRGHRAVELVADARRSQVRVRRTLTAQSKLASTPAVALAQGILKLLHHLLDLQHSSTPSLQVHCDGSFPMNNGLSSPGTCVVHLFHASPEVTNSSSDPMFHNANDLILTT